MPLDRSDEAAMRRWHGNRPSPLSRVAGGGERARARSGGTIRGAPIHLRGKVWRVRCEARRRNEPKGARNVMPITSWTAAAASALLAGALGACSAADSQNDLFAGRARARSSCTSPSDPRCSDGGAVHGVGGEGDAPGTSPDASAPPGDAPPASDVSTTGDAGTLDAAGDGPSDASHKMLPDATACINGVASPGDGHHNPGQDCLGCHQNLVATKKWTVAGTLFASLSSSTPLRGATLEVIDANGAVLRLPTYDNGNFYTATPVAFPVTVRASNCPAGVSMVGAATQGSCNTCHGAGSHIHL
jgi:hypothetical protein